MSGDDDALSGALDAVVTRFERLLRHVGSEHQLAPSAVDELIQDVRIRLWHAQRSGERIQRLAASYIYRTALSAARDLIRRARARREQPIEAEARATAAPPPQDTELAAEIACAIEGLAQPRQAVVRMYLAGYTGPEIATFFGWTESKTRNLVYRGLADLRVALRARGVAPEVPQ